MLVDGLSWASGWQSPWSVPTKGALAQARSRLGPEPLRALFEAVAVPLAATATRGRVLPRLEACKHRRDVH